MNFLIIFNFEIQIFNSQTRTHNQKAWKIRGEIFSKYFLEKYSASDRER